MGSGEELYVAQIRLKAAWTDWDRASLGTVGAI